MAEYPVTIHYTGTTAKGMELRLELIGSLALPPKENQIVSASNGKRVSSLRIAEVENRSVPRLKDDIIVYASPDDRVVSYVDEIRDDFRAAGWSVKDVTPR